MNEEMKMGDQRALEERLIAECRQCGLKVATAESCTGGLIAERLTSVPGASAVFLGGVVSYANEVKRDLLGVPEDLLERVGAVSAECAASMAAGVRKLMKADAAVSVTGVAGPDGGSPLKPVGLVYVGVATAAGAQVERCLFSGDRGAIRCQAAERALTRLLEAVRGTSSLRA